MSALNFRQHEAWGELLLRWWQGLDDDRGGRAALRRAPDITAVVMLPVYQHLHRRLVAAGWPDSACSVTGVMKRQAASVITTRTSIPPLTNRRVRAAAL